MSLRSWLIAKSYDLAMQGTEQRCLAAWRAELLAGATGELLEIGAGTGLNLDYYPKSLPRLILSEPEPQMRQQLKSKHQRSAHHQAEITSWEAEELQLPDACLDTIISTLVLCTVKNQASALRELHRVLRPGGCLIFLEHVISRQPGIARWQKRLEPLWSCCSGNCHLTRDTAANIEATGFEMSHLLEAEMPGVPGIFKRTVRGVARKGSGPAI